MPKFFIYSILDTKAQEFSPLFLAPTEQVAKRMVLESMKGPGNLMGAYPEDFLLYTVGDFETSSGSIETGEYPHLVCGVQELFISPRGAQNHEG